MILESNSYKYQWRITKYNPANRNERGYYMTDDWVMPNQIGDIINGEVFTKAEYLKMEDRYVAAAKELFLCSGLKTLAIRELQAMSIPPDAVKNGLDNIKNIKPYEGQHIEIQELDTITRLMLREMLWCKLENPKKLYIHIGRDYYMYIGCSKNLADAITKATANGLYVEECPSPYLAAV